MANTVGEIKIWRVQTLHRDGVIRQLGKAGWRVLRIVYPPKGQDLPGDPWCDIVAQFDPSSQPDRRDSPADFVASLSRHGGGPVNR